MTISSGKRASAWDSVRGMWPSGIGLQFSLEATSPGDSSLTAQSALHLASGQQQHLELSGWFSSFPRRAPCFAMNLLTSFACTVSAGWQSFLTLPIHEHFCTYRWWDQKLCFCFCHSLAQSFKNKWTNNNTEDFFQREFKDINKIMVTSVTNTVLR